MYVAAASHIPTPMKITIIHSVTVGEWIVNDQPTKHFSNMGMKTTGTTKD